MKKTIFFTVALLATIISGRLYAQEDVNASSVASLGATAYHPAAVSSINARAIKDFKGRYARIADEQWSNLEKGVCVVFSKDSARTTAFYDRKGHWQASVTYCDEKKLPFFVRDMVRRANYDLPITVVNIVEVPDHTVYLVHVEDAKYCRIIRVTEEGDMDVLDEFYKSN